MTDFVCAVLEKYRDACDDAEYQGTGYCVLHLPGSSKRDDFKNAVQNRLVKNSYKAFNFRGAVVPEGTSDFRDVEFGEKVDFEGAAFMGKADFIRAIFKKSAGFSDAIFEAEADFSGATFEAGTKFIGATFEAEANFSKATFKGNVDFSKASFEKEVNFDEATFHGEANFFEATFKGTARFVETAFEGSAPFWRAKFNGDAYFFKAKFLNRTGFSARKNFEAFNLDLEREVLFDYVEVEKPELFAFHSLQLRPSWFIYVEDTPKLKFHEVQWYGLREGPKAREQNEANAFRNEVATLRSRKRRKGLRHPEKQNIKRPHPLLARTYRRLSRNYEDNREYPVANETHYWSMNALRKEKWNYRKQTWDGLVWIRKNWRRVAKRCGMATTLCLVWGRISRRHLSRPRRFGLIRTLYWALSGYVVRPARAFGWLVVMWVVFALLYMLMGPKELQVFSASEAWNYFAQHIWTSFDLFELAVAGFSVPLLLVLIAPSLSEIEHFIADIWPALVYSLGALARLRPKPLPDGPSWFQFFVTAEGILGPLQVALLALAVRRKVMR